MKRLWFVSLVVIAALLLTSIPVMAAAPENNGNNSVNATDVQIVKKVPIKGPAPKGSKPASYAATGITGQPLPNGGTKYAMVIGINDYPDSANDLDYCVNDANLMADVLTDVYGFKSIDFIINGSATYENIKAKIIALSNKAGSDDEVVFFFSGHGAKGRASDGDRNNTDQSIVVNRVDGSWGYIWDGELKSWFSGFTANRIVFIFDSCLSGGMSVLNGANRVVNMACSANGLSYEGAQWGNGHGQFTYYFAEQGMEVGKADVHPDDNQVTVEEAFDYAKSLCVYQTPAIADGFTNDLLP